MSPDTRNSAKHMGATQLQFLEQMNEGRKVRDKLPIESKLELVFINKIKQKQNNVTQYPFASSINPGK